jgi:hypothetical protein
MRTTIDMPASLMRAAKIRATARGESLKDLVNRAVAHEVGLANAPREKTRRVVLPLLGRDGAPTVVVTNADIEAALEADDIDRYGGT